MTSAHRGSLLRRLAIPVVLASVSILGTSGAATAAPAGPVTAAPAGPVTAAPIHIFRCSSQGTYTGIWVNSRLTWCVANAGTLIYRITNVTSINGGNNAGYINYTTRTGGSGGATFAKHQTLTFSQITINYINIY